MISEKDERWFCNNVHKMQSTMFYVAYSILNNKYDCEDAASNAIVLAYEHLEQLKDKRKFSSWLLRILKNECYKILNKNSNYVFMEEVPDIIINDNSEETTDNW